MKVLILACLVALALAREKEELKVSGVNAERLPSSEQKLEKFKHEEQQQREDERQDKIHPFLQPQPLVDPYTEPIPYTVFTQNVLPLARPAMVLPFLQPEITEVPKTKQTMLPKRKLMPILESPTATFTERQTLNPFALPLLQPFVHQVPRLLPQTPLIPPQSLPSLPQPKVLTLPQQVVPYPQRDMPVQALLLYQEPLLDSTQEFYPVTKPLAPVSNPIFN